MTLEIGDKAPDFSLKDQNGKDIKLTGLRGTPYRPRKPGQRNSVSRG
jgi:hypothetical protein